MWLLEKLFTHKDQPKPRFAFQGTVNWMRALSILCEDEFTNEKLTNFYSHVKRRQPNDAYDALAFECLVMSMHNASAINAMVGVNNSYLLVRSAIVSWYYSVYYASKAMIAANSGADPQTHTLTGKVLQSEIIHKNLLKAPFSFNLTNLIPSHINNSISSMRGANGYDLNSFPENAEMALGAVISYLKGTAEYEQWRLEQRVKESSAYKQAGYNNFKTSAAKVLRDSSLQNGIVNFIVQAFRYRGKANYRDALYLSYGDDNQQKIDQFLSDLNSVSNAFSLMASYYVSRRVSKNNWVHFSNDLLVNVRFSLPFDITKI